ncbi:General transcriptional corepressor CYC8 [Erysiphe neolycopersici]|uniref:General transcriptional corepressor CYC8 n=1 Tax=Erysiphe neolycopersici TaxID=212602 RepID=A0A420HPI0_9PEZI|nr:General transcriptional corepressor CYC8 [Erysiphe neolycopersici]
MATHHPSTPPTGMQILHNSTAGPPPGMPQSQFSFPLAQQLVTANETVWLQIGSLAEVLNSPEEAMNAYEHALRANPRSTQAMSAMSGILRTQEQFLKAIEYLQSILKMEPTNGEVWGSIGHCYLMMDDLQQAYTSYQQALYHLRDPKEPKLWYGIGILYDRYGSLDHAEEAFSQVMRMQPDFEKANEIYFRLGIIYKQQHKYHQSLECFRYIVALPPAPLTEEDIWFQIGHVYEQQKELENAKMAYQRVLDRDPNHAKVLQQLGWLYHQQNQSFSCQEQALEYLEKSVNSDPSDAQTWYLLGRCYMAQQKYPKAYEAYQQAVYRDGKNPTFWCSIGVLYYQINQYRDALDAYSRAIRLNPFISEVWYDLGTLYESCNNQINDALDAYQRAAELDQNNPHIKARLQLLRNQQASGIPIQSSAPVPQDVHPQAYQARGAVGPPGPQWGNSGAPPPVGPPNGPPNGWGNRLPEMTSTSHPPIPFEQRDPPRSQARPILQQPSRVPMSPLSGPEQMRPFSGPSPRGPLPPTNSLPIRSPHNHHSIMTSHAGQGITQTSAPQPNQLNNSHHHHQQQQQQQEQQQQQKQHQPTQVQMQTQHSFPRVYNPNYAGPGATNNIHGVTNGVNSVSLGNSLPPFARNNSPRTEVRVLHDSRMSSPKPGYPIHTPFQLHSEIQHHVGIENSGPMPVSALSSAESAAAERNGDHTRPGSVGPKRLREARLMDTHHRRQSTPPRDSAFRRSPPSASKEYPPEDRERDRLDHLPPISHPTGETERAKRKMVIDEDYDDDGDDDKKVSGLLTAGSGSVSVSVSGDSKNTSPTLVNGNAVNGVANVQPKLES